jgi:hypothetical protein
MLARWAKEVMFHLWFPRKGVYPREDIPTPTLERRIAIGNQ